MGVVIEICFNGLRASYWVWGGGRPMLFLHSGGSHGGQWTWRFCAMPRAALATRSSWWRGHMSPLRPPPKWRASSVITRPRAAAWE